MLYMRLRDRANWDLDGRRWQHYPRLVSTLLGSKDFLDSLKFSMEAFCCERGSFALFSIPQSMYFDLELPV